MNPESFTAKYGLKFYLINIGLLIFGAFCWTGTLDEKMVLIEKIGLVLLGGLFISLVPLLFSASVTEVQLGPNGFLVKRPWRPDMTFRYDQLSAIDRDKISFIDRRINQVGDALAIYLSLMANGDELIVLIQKGMNEKRIPFYSVDEKARVKTEATERLKFALLFLVYSIVYIIVFSLLGALLYSLTGWPLIFPIVLFSPVIVFIGYGLSRV